MQIFVSYSRKDKLFCDAVVRELQAFEDVEVYIDTSEPMPGTSLPDQSKMR